MRALQALAMIVILSTAPVHAADLIWEYGQGTVPPTADVQRSAAQSGPFTTIATIPSLPSVRALPASPDNQWYRIQNLGGVSNVVQYAAPVTAPTATGPTLDQRVANLEAQLTDLTTRTTAAESKLAGLCRATIAMGGTSTTLAGRIRREVPCP